MLIEIRIEPTDRAKTLALLSSEPLPDYISLFTHNNATHSIPIHLSEYLIPGKGKLVDEELFRYIADRCREAMKLKADEYATNDFLTATGDIRNFLNQLSVAAEANELYSDTKVGKIYLHNI